MARKRSAGRKTLLRAFYRQILRHGFALGVAAGPGPGTYADGLALADGPLGRAAVELGANEFAERDLDDTRQMATGGLVTQPTYTLLGEAGPEMVIPLSPSMMMQPAQPKKTRKPSKYNRTFGRMLKQVKQTSRLKDGSYRKGWSSSKEMSKAHKLTRKMMK